MTDSWFRNMPPLLPSSIAPVPQDKPPVVLTILALVIAVSPVVGFVIWGWM